MKIGNFDADRKAIVLKTDLGKVYCAIPRPRNTWDILVVSNGSGGGDHLFPCDALIHNKKLSLEGDRLRLEGEKQGIAFSGISEASDFRIETEDTTFAVTFWGKRWELKSVDNEVFTGSRLIFEKGMVEFKDSFGREIMPAKKFKRLL